MPVKAGIINQKGVLMTNKDIFRQLQIKVRPKGLHKSLTPDPWPLTPALSTTVEDSLQISPVFMQNEPNFRKSQMNVTSLITVEYEDKTLGQRGKNEPKTNPNKANFTSSQTERGGGFVAGAI